MEDWRWYPTPRLAGGLAIEEAVLQHVEEGSHGILPADFSCPFHKSAVIGNRHLVDAAAQLGLPC